jgi:hypothetical protein
MLNEKCDCLNCPVYHRDCISKERYKGRNEEMERDEAQHYCDVSQGDYYVALPLATYPPRSLGSLPDNSASKFAKSLPPNIIFGVGLGVGVILA